MNPRTIDPAESLTLYTLGHRYTDAWARLVPECSREQLEMYVSRVEELEREMRRLVATPQPFVTLPSRNGTQKEASDAMP